MNILERNETALRKRNDKFFEKYKEKKQSKYDNCTVETGIENKNIIYYYFENHRWRLNSMYEPEIASAMYAERYGVIKDYAVLCIFGLSDGKVIRNLINNCNGTQKLVIYEASIDIFCTAMETFPLEDIFENENVELIVEELNELELENILQSAINIHNRELLEQCILPNYDLIFSKECKDFIEKILYFSQIEIFVKNTEIDDGIRYGDNAFQNLLTVLKESSTNELCKYFRTYKISEIPAIIVSAGPSLDKNIKVLKQAEGKAFIIGVDSALRVLVGKGIHVNLAVSVDPHKNLSVFADDRVNDIPYMVSTAAVPPIAKKNRKRLFFESVEGFETFEKIIKDETEKVFGVIKTGGSVATDAFSLACDMGFQKIIMVGQDLAFTNGKGHVSGFEISEEADRSHVQSRSRVMVDAYDGGQVETDIQMQFYLKWFEMEIASKKDIIVYNATEGGAKIHGTVQIPLKEAIQKLCIREINFDKIIDNVPYMFTGEEQNRLKEKFLKMDENLECLRNKLQKGIQAYNILVKFKDKPYSADYKEAVKIISRVNEMDQTDPYIGIVRQYAKKGEYNATEGIYIIEDMTIEELAERGIQLLNVYLEGISMCKARINQFLIPNLKK